jgi:hypothetical protein
MSNPVPQATPEDADVSAPEVITPAMIEAGIDALCNSALSDGGEWNGDEYDEIATRVYLAMRLAASREKGNG